MIVRGNEGGATWSELARLDPLAAVLDPGDRSGVKNAVIDRVHKVALGRTAGRLDGVRALDFGCGTGRLSRWLVDRGAHVDGVDITPEMVDVARRLVPEATFATIAGAELPFASGTFDLAVCAYVLQYYVSAERDVPREIARVLRSGGRLLAIEQVTDDGPALGRGGTVGEYERMFEDAGLRVRSARAIRLGGSRVVDAAQRHPAARALRLLPWLILAETRVHRGGAAYADVLFTVDAA